MSNEDQKPEETQTHIVEPPIKAVHPVENGDDSQKGSESKAPDVIIMPEDNGASKNENVEIEGKVNRDENDMTEDKVDRTENIETIEGKVDTNGSIKMERKVDTNENVTMERKVGIDENIERELKVDTNENVETEGKVDTSENVITEGKVDTNENIETRNIDMNEHFKTERKVDTNENVETERKVDANENVKTQRKVDTNESVELERKVDTNENVETERKVDTNENVETEGKVVTFKNVETEGKVVTFKNVETEGKVDTNENIETESLGNTEKGDSSTSEESWQLSELKENEKKALAELRSKLEEAILGNTMLNQQDQKEKSTEELKNTKEGNQAPEEQETVIDEGNNKKKQGKSTIENESNKDLTLWGVPLLPSKGHEGTDILLLKFLKAREFKANEAFEMLKNTLQWRKENQMDSVLEEDFGNEYDSLVYMSGVDRKGHPVCYNNYGIFANDNTFNKTFGTEESRRKFLRWRLQFMEKEIQKLEFKREGVSSLLQINDLKNAPGPSRKELRLTTREAVGLLQDNYPEFVATNIFINVPFWYYAFNALLSPFLTQRTKSKFVFTRPSKVTETLLKYISAEEIPVQYGGLKQENDPDFSPADVASEIIVKAGSTETIEIPTPEVGSTLLWDLTVLGWEVNYKEEFVPSDEGSYMVIVKKGRKIGWQEDSVRNSFINKEPGKIVLTIENGTFKKKRAFYRYMTKNSS